MERKIVQLPLLSIVLTMALQGSGFISEMYLVNLMIQSDAFRALGETILIVRLSHAFLTVYVLVRIFGPDAWSARYESLIDTKHMMAEIKVYSIVVFLSFVEAPLNRFLPFYDTEFARQSQGYPDFHLFALSLTVKLVQSLITVGCQFAFLSQIYASNVNVGSTALAYLFFNVSTTVLMILINLTQAAISTSVLIRLEKDPASKKIIIVKSGENGGHHGFSSSSSSKNSVMINNSLNSSFQPHGSNDDDDEDVEMAVANNKRITGTDTDTDGANPIHFDAQLSHHQQQQQAHGSDASTEHDSLLGKKVDVLEEKTRAMEDEARQQKEYQRAAEEKARVMEEKARVMEEKARVMEEKLLAQDAEMASIKKLLSSSLSPSSSSHPN